MTIAQTARSTPLFYDVSGLLEPRSIAIVGASDRPGNLGGAAIRFLQKFGYPGQVWPVNPNQPAVAGAPCFPSVRDLPGPADAARRAELARTAAGLTSTYGKAKYCPPSGPYAGKCLGQSEMEKALVAGNDFEAHLG